MFNDCKDAEKYNNIEEDEENDAKERVDVEVDVEQGENLSENQTEAQVTPPEESSPVNDTLSKEVEMTTENE